MPPPDTIAGRLYGALPEAGDLMVLNEDGTVSPVGPPPPDHMFYADGSYARFGGSAREGTHDGIRVSRMDARIAMGKASAGVPEDTTLEEARVLWAAMGLTFEQQQRAAAALGWEIQYGPERPPPPPLLTWHQVLMADE